MSKLIGMMVSDSFSFLGGVRVDFHKHILYPTNISSHCHACENSEERVGCQSGYICKPCKLYVHKDCVDISNPYRHKHPLKLLEFDSTLDDGRTCSFCGKRVKHDKPLFYYCFKCDLTFCNRCPSIPLFIDDVHKKIHEHSLTQMMIKVSFACDACGICGDGYPCVCLQCRGFIIHRDCVKLPRVIHVNRHDHRISHTYSLGPGDWVCGVCRKGIGRSCGAYSCFICSYAVHSKCATRDDVWDGVELEDIPEDDEDIDPFVVIGEGVIKHFSHDHHLRSLVDGNSDNRYCYACTLPIHSDPYYTCMECGFILHQTCASLPKKKRHELSNHQLTLCINPQGEYFDDRHIRCGACNRQCTGFYYKNDYAVIDVRCVQVSNKINHESHPHPLFSISTENKLCTGCGDSESAVMSCIECDFDLCFHCATLPKEVRHKYDRHPLSLCYGETKSERGVYWCEICERETNPNDWFYTCNDCGSTLHVYCVLGGYLHVRPGHKIITYDEEFEVVANDRPTRPFCRSCKRRCVQPFAYMSKANNTYMCGYSCLLEYQESYSSERNLESEEDVSE